MLPRFAADLDWLKRCGAQVKRHNLAQEPMAFASHPQVRAILTATNGTQLPIVVVNGQVVSQAVYPTREELSKWTGVQKRDEPIGLPTLQSKGSCCDGGTCG